MQSITELTALHRAAYSAVDCAIDDDAGAASMNAVYEVEDLILCAPIATKADRKAALGLLHDGGDVDFADKFKEQLCLRLLNLL